MNSELPTSNIIIIIKFACLFVCLINVTFILHLLLIFCHFSLCFVLAFFFLFFFLGRGDGGGGGCCIYHDCYRLAVLPLIRLVG